MAVITLTTDLGTRDHYAASLKGTLLHLVPGALIVDISHEIAHFNLMEAAFVAKSACPKFPADSIHIIGVDPEGGSRLGMVIMRQDAQFYIAPDNGVLSLIRYSDAAECVHVDMEAMSLPSQGRAFLVQNRMAQIAAALAGGQSMESLGTAAPIKDFRWGEPSYNDSSLRGVIVHVDHFGNAITNVQKDAFMELKGERSFQIFVRNLRIQRIVGSYGDASKGDSLALFSDNGHLEIAIREGSAAKLLGLKVQDMITIEFYG